MAVTKATDDGVLGEAVMDTLLHGHCRDRDVAATWAFARNQDVRHHPLPVAREHPARATVAREDLVDDQHRARGVT